MGMRALATRKQGECAAEDRVCVDCVCEALSERAETISREELRRAVKRLKALNGADDSIVREMAVNLARRIVHSPMRRLLKASAHDRLRMAAEIRETFGLAEPDGCPLTLHADAPLTLHHYGK